MSAEEEPVVFICGPTGSGKTAVSIKLAQELGGEVINADVYQMYKGLNIATAKITKNEMRGIPHHLLSVHDPKERINVTDFLQSATQAICHVRDKGKIPIVVGGSNFYLESLLFSNALLQPRPNDVTTPSPVSSSSSPSSPSPALAADLLAMSGSELHTHLQLVNPAAASLLHPRDSRRVLRALQRHREGESLSSSSSSSSSSSVACPPPPLRYPLSLVVHVSCAGQQEHVARLHCRVEDMVHSGLVQETRLLYQYLRSAAEHCWEDFASASRATREEESSGITNISTSTSTAESERVNAAAPRELVSSGGKGGVAEAIGFKEFLPYFDAEAEAEAAVTSAEGGKPGNVGMIVSNSAEGEGEDDCPGDFDSASLLSRCVADIQHSTVQYAKRQATWLRNRLLPQSALRGAVLFSYCPIPPPPPVAELCGEDKDKDNKSGERSSEHKDNSSGCGGGVCVISSARHSTLASLVAAMSSHLEQRATATATATSCAQLNSSSSNSCLKHDNTDADADVNSDNKDKDNRDRDLDSDRMTLKRKIFHCETCVDQCFQGKEQFDIHTKSKKHKKRVASQRKREQRRGESNLETPRGDTGLSDS